MERKLLDSVNSPEDLKKLSDNEIPLLCSEIREFLIENIGKSGGHMASNLGVTELSVALHRVFDSPKDHIIFDVGHQGYVHKIITGRKDGFKNLREPGGLSGFTTRREGEHDPFGAGHSSTSVSASLGFAEADALKGSEAYTVCVIGDGAYTGGMVHEALNNCRRDLRFVIVLNENRMSISKNIGAFASYIAKVRVSKGYRRWKNGTNSLLRHIPLIGKPIQSLLSWAKNKIKRVLYPSNYFEDLGLYYIGPVDGNDYKSIEKALADAKSIGKCVVVHAYTKKGKGFEPAERSPDDFHSYSVRSEDKTLHSAFADNLIEMAADDDKILAITAAMGMGTGLVAFEKQYQIIVFHILDFTCHGTSTCLLTSARCRQQNRRYQRKFQYSFHDVVLFAWHPCA